ncbi:hypothetical protein [Paenibacillus mendelii]|uniref:FlxA protein n=1 Tax=Paenibacillus mendelii TaxID=206163 RepID=A0ABV6J779_9BACL|nr:hypothetical protein [Paenibacillus mendelii]MCQ6562089.1 hypothetical protein [Paenibacillus mendelii]
MENQNQGQTINSQQMSYQQFQEQVQQQQAQERIQAQQALRNAGLDQRSQKVNQVVIEIQNIQHELQLAENQIQMQMDAQKRQIQNILQRLQQAEQQVKSTISAISAEPAQSSIPIQ